MSNLSARILKFNNSLLPEMVQLKYQLMSENAFRFFRGTCHLFYEDLHNAEALPASPNTWVCGDLHLENFGSFKGNNRMVYFDLNDFDESGLAPALWDVSRMATSIFVAFYTLNIDPGEASRAAELFLSTYSTVLSKGKAYSIDPRTAKGIVRNFLKKIKGRKETDLIKHVIGSKAKQFKINIDNKTHFPIDEPLRTELMAYLRERLANKKEWLKNYAVMDVAFRVAGTGSVGLKRYMLLLQNVQSKKKFILVEMKESVASTLAPYLSVKQPKWNSDAERIVIIKQRMQNISPALLSPALFKGDQYILQEMQPVADKIKFELIESNYDYLDQVISDMALLTASAQIRSGGIQGSAINDQLTVFGRRNDWQQPVLDYATRYSKKVLKDYKQFLMDLNNQRF